MKASLTGSIIGNVLLVFGAAALVGGLKHPAQRFNRTAAGIGTTMLLLSAIGLIVPAVFHRLARSGGSGVELKLDTEIAVVLFVTYGASLVFTLRTHRDLFGPRRGRSRRKSAHGKAEVRRAVIMLLRRNGSRRGGQRTAGGVGDGNGRAISA